MVMACTRVAVSAPLEGAEGGWEPDHEPGWAAEAGGAAEAECAGEPD